MLKEFSFGQFKIDLLKCENCEPITNFDTLSSNFLILPQIFLPKRISTTSIISNIFSYLSSSVHTISGNVTCTVSDHLSQLLFLSEFFTNFPPSKPNIFKQNWKKSKDQV